MKIVSIFTPNLYAFILKDKSTNNYYPTNELEKVLDLWNDTEYLYKFAKANKELIPRRHNIISFIETINQLAAKIDEKLEELAKVENLEIFFKALDNNEYRLDFNLSRQKGREQFLRIYALKVDFNCYIITGGAIKLTHTMDQHEQTRKEKVKLNRCKDFLKEQGVEDIDSFQEFILQA